MRFFGARIYKTSTKLIRLTFVWFAYVMSSNVRTCHVLYHLHVVTFFFIRIRSHVVTSSNVRI